MINHLYHFLNDITPVYLIYLLYGAAFLFLGVAIAAKDMRGSDLPLTSSLWLLSMFGFLHGAHEWLELGPLIEGEHLDFNEIFTIKAVSVLLVILSFIFLLQFGLSQVRSFGRKQSRWSAAIPVPLWLLWFVYVWHYGLADEGFHVNMQALRQADIGARYTFGLAGALLTAYGLITTSRKMSALSLPVSRRLHYAGVSFGFYAVFMGVFSSHFMMPFIAVPVAVFRGASAFFITYFMTKALNIFDIELRAKYDEQAKSIMHAEKLSSLGRLAAGIAHEINNPLTNASLGIETLRESVKGNGMENKIVEKLDAVERNIDKAAVIAAELLQFARQKEPAFAPMSVHDAIKGALSLLRHRMRNVTVLQDFGLVPAVYGDADKLERVFINILSNSLEAMPYGGEVSIRTEQADGFVVVRTSDTGPGISKENLHKVFDPFFTTKEVGMGTGLGLAICYGIIGQHQGMIEIANAPVRGTVVTIKLPPEGGR
jgi:two-component system NtrC family sensor kinase